MIALAELTLGCQPRHLIPGIAMETVARHHGGINAFACEYAAKAIARRGSAGAGGTGYGNDGVTSGHRMTVPEALNQAA